MNRSSKKYFYDFFSAEIWARFFKTPKKMIEEFGFFDKKPKSVLEIGTAEGYNIRELVKRGIISNAVGYDISKSRIEIAKDKIKKENLEEKIQIVLGNGKDLNFEDNSFDIVLLPQILEHLPTKKDVRGMISGALRISKQGLLISLPLKDSSNFFVRISKYTDPDHIKGLVLNKNSWIYNPQKVENLFKEMGLDFKRSTNNNEFYRVKKSA